MTVNPLGTQILFDGENPRTFTATARTVISGGDLVVVSGAANGVGSQVSSYANGDIVVDIIHDSNRCNGIALNNAGSNELVTVATRGTYLVRSAGVISGGYQIIPVSGTTQGVARYNVSGVGNGTPIGRNLIDTASGNALFTAVALNV